MRLKENITLIIGSGSGIRRGIALAMSKKGPHVVNIDVNEESGKVTLEELNEFQQGILFIKDISKQDKVSEIVKQVIEYYGKIDILINNAHASKQANFMDTTQTAYAAAKEAICAISRVAANESGT